MPGMVVIWKLTIVLNASVFCLCCSDSPGHLEEKVSQLEAMLKKLQDDLQKVIKL